MPRVGYEVLTMPNTIREKSLEGDFLGTAEEGRCPTKFLGRAVHVVDLLQFQDIFQVILNLMTSMKVRFAIKFIVILNLCCLQSVVLPTLCSFGTEKAYRHVESKVVVQVA